MSNMIQHITHRCGGVLRRFRRDEDGSATIEFIVALPLYIFLLLSAFESGLLMTRQVLLDRSLDLAIRQVRIGGLSPVTHETLKQEICDNALMIPDCMNSVKIEARNIDLLAWQNIPAEADCIDRADSSAPLVSFQTGGANQMTVVRVCALFNPVFPTSGIGAQIPRESGDEYALIASSAYVREPR